MGTWMVQVDVPFGKTMLMQTGKRIPFASCVFGSAEAEALLDRRPIASRIVFTAGKTVDSDLEPAFSDT